MKTDKVRDIDDYKGTVKDAVIVTASSNEYFPWLLNMIGSIQRNYPGHPPIFVYSIDLRKSYINELRSICGVTVKRIPPFVSHWNRCYTWKPWVMNDVPGRIVYFLDAASEVLRPLTEIFEFIDKDGCFCVSQISFKYLLRDITPQDLLERLGLDMDFCKEREYFGSGNFGFKKGTLYHNCVKEVLELAKEGWTLGWSSGEQNRNKGHGACDIVRDCKVFRHEQTLLNLLFYQKCGNFKIHDENRYAGFLSRDLHPGQLVWNSRKKNKELIYLNKLRYKNPLYIFEFLINRFHFLKMGIGLQKYKQSAIYRRLIHPVYNTIFLRRKNPGR
ncbi:MAG: DUF1647 domain-containing protein [Candidatus Omnitrophota bacterium]